MTPCWPVEPPMTKSEFTLNGGCKQNDLGKLRNVTQRKKIDDWRDIAIICSKENTLRYIMDCNNRCLYFSDEISPSKCKIRQ